MTGPSIWHVFSPAVHIPSLPLAVIGGEQKELLMAIPPVSKPHLLLESKKIILSNIGVNSTPHPHALFMYEDPFETRRLAFMSPVSVFFSQNLLIIK